MKWFSFGGLFLLLGCSSTLVPDAELTRASVIHGNWQVVNDTVMGGVSTSRWSVDTDGTGQFSGDVSLENFGGFASVRGGVPEDHFGTSSRVRLRIKGDGKVYKFCLRTSQMGRSVSYQHDIQTTGDWQDVELALDAFVARWRGRVVGDAVTLRAVDVTGVGFLIADKQAGTFTLQVASIEGGGEISTP